MNLDEQLTCWAAEMKAVEPSLLAVDQVMDEIMSTAGKCSVADSLEEQLHWLMGCSDLSTVQATFWILALLLNMTRTVSGISPALVP